MKYMDLDYIFDCDNSKTLYEKQPRLRLLPTILIEKVTKKDVEEIANEIKIDTIYFLRD